MIIDWTSLGIGVVSTFILLGLYAFIFRKKKSSSIAAVNLITEDMHKHLQETNKGLVALRTILNE